MYPYHDMEKYTPIVTLQQGYQSSKFDYKPNGNLQIKKIFVSKCSSITLCDWYCNMISVTVFSAQRHHWQFKAAYTPPQSLYQYLICREVEGQSMIAGKLWCKVTWLLARILAIVPGTIWGQLALNWMVLIHDRINCWPWATEGENSRSS